MKFSSTRFLVLSLATAALSAGLSACSSSSSEDAPENGGRDPRRVAELLTSEAVAGGEIKLIKPLLYGDLAICDSFGSLFVVNSRNPSAPDQRLQRLATDCEPQSPDLIDQLEDGTIVFQSSRGNDASDVRLINRNDGTVINRFPSDGLFKTFGNNLIIVRDFDNSARVYSTTGTLIRRIPFLDRIIVSSYNNSPLMSLSQGRMLVAARSDENRDRCKFLILDANGGLQGEIQDPECSMDVYELQNGNLASFETNRTRRFGLNSGVDIEMKIHSPNGSQIGSYSFPTDQREIRPVDGRSLALVNLSDNHFVVFTQTTQGNHPVANIFNQNGEFQNRFNLPGIPYALIPGISLAKTSHANRIGILSVIHQNAPRERMGTFEVAFTLVSAEGVTESEHQMIDGFSNNSRVLSLLDGPGGYTLTGTRLQNSSPQYYGVTFYDVQGHLISASNGNSSPTFETNGSYIQIQTPTRFVYSSITTTDARADVINFLDPAAPSNPTQTTIGIRPFMSVDSTTSPLTAGTETQSYWSTSTLTPDGVTAIGTDHGLLLLFNSDGQLLREIQTGLTAEQARSFLTEAQTQEND